MKGTLINPSISDFEKLRTKNYKYVDKTNIICDLIQNYGTFLLNRPRRFGKSLIISTLENFFLGKKYLFENLFIYDKIDNWEEFPIIKFDFSLFEIDEKEDLIKLINYYIKVAEDNYQIESEEEKNFSFRISNFFSKCNKKYNKQIVVLIDEYDAPLLNNLNNKELFDEILKILRNFFLFFKSNQSKIRFVFITGISKFSINNLFSGANNIFDISEKKEYVNICGFSENEIQKNFKKEIEEIAYEKKLDLNSFYNDIKKYYDGYKFSYYQIEDLYNPIDILGLVQFKRFDFFWFKSGIPSFLIKYIKTNNILLQNLIEKNFNLNDFNEIDTFKMTPISIFYQIGYLTIDKYDEKKKLYKMKFTNYEIEFNFFNYIKKFFFNYLFTENEYEIFKFKEELNLGQVEKFCKRLSIFFMDNNYQLMGNKEIYYHNCVYIFCKLLGFNSQVEIITNNGRIDMVLETIDYIYIIEFKYNKNADIALKQIKNKEYYNKFLLKEKKIYLIGINFDENFNKITYKYELFINKYI